MVIEVATALAVVHRILNGRNSRPILAIDSSNSRGEDVGAYGNTPGARVLRLVRLV